jgi:hypothetical protein
MKIKNLEKFVDIVRNQAKYIRLVSGDKELISCFSLRSAYNSGDLRNCFVMWKPKPKTDPQTNYYLILSFLLKNYNYNAYKCCFISDRSLWPPINFSKPFYKNLDIVSFYNETPIEINSKFKTKEDIINMLSIMSKSHSICIYIKLCKECNKSEELKKFNQNSVLLLRTSSNIRTYKYPQIFVEDLDNYSNCNHFALS